ncbi:MAG: hypothetical protein IKC59_00440, partial [Clostridia bacterium]|nr:hypothetical protein [Clostridia bacterium]
MKKLISCLLLLAMLLTAFAACKKKDTGNTEQPTQTVELDEYGRPKVDNAIIAEGIRFDDVEIAILYYDEYQIYNSDLVGEMVNDANFSRDMSAENALGVVLDYQHVEHNSSNEMRTYNDKVIRSISSGDSYNILMTHPYYSSNMAMQGYYQNVRNLKYIDFNQPWWTEKVMEEITINDVSYFASGDMTTANCGSTTCMFYNKELYSARYTDNIYEVVNGKDWTIERLSEMVKEVYVNTDGESGTTQGDFLGLATAPNSSHADPFLYGFGVRITRLNSNGELEIALGDEWSVNSFAAAYDLFQNNEGVWHKNVADDYEWVLEKFANSESLFVAGSFGHSTKLTDMSARYGVLPAPLLNKSQESYYSGGVDGLLAVPINAKNLDATAAAMDVLNYYGYQFTVPVYFEKMLKTQYADAPEDSAVYELLHDVKTIDFGAVYSYSMNNPLWTWRKQLREGSNNISQHWAE